MGRLQDWSYLQGGRFSHTTVVHIAHFFPIVHGLLYIHNECSLYHGALAGDTVLLNRDGFIKIGERKLLQRM